VGDDRTEAQEILGEGVHTAFRKATDAPQAAKIHQLINEMGPLAWGEYVSWLDDALCVMGYSAIAKED
jgi:hypothetical protein